MCPPFGQYLKSEALYIHWPRAGRDSRMSWAGPSGYKRESSGGAKGFKRLHGAGGDAS